MPPRRPPSVPAGRALAATLAAALALPTACARGPATPWEGGSDAEVIDLTYGFGPETVYWPTATPFARKDTFRGVTPAGFFYSAGDYAASEHGGTHMDAPVHFVADGAAADAVPGSRLAGRAWVLDAREPCAADRDHLVSRRDLEAAERAAGPLPRGAVVLVLTGWGRFWPEKKAYLGDDRPGKTDGLSFPGLDPELARALVAAGVRAVGIDTASIDRGRSSAFEAHRVLAAAGVPIFENVAGLERLLGRPAWIVAAPMKIEGGTGAPLRLFALAPAGAR
jgi:kynurenine formamidase